MERSVVEKERISKLNAAPVRERGKYVLYWMQASVRAVRNPALEYAVERANDADVPVLVVFGLFEKYPEASERHFAFLLECISDAGKQLEERGIEFVLVHQVPTTVVKALAADAVSVVTDRGYLRLLREWRSQVATEIDCRMVQIEGDVVVPVQLVSDKEETAARTIRPKIHKYMPKFLHPLERVTPKNTTGKAGMLTSTLATLKEFELLDWRDPLAVLAKLDVDRSVPRVTWITGGATHAEAMLADFLKHKLKDFAANRNEPAQDFGSNMSPYLHYGSISVVHLVMEALKHKTSASKEGVDSFIEELVVRRELSMNLVFYNPHYDAYACIPNYARITLDEHRHDERKPTYTLQELEAGVTYDECWNACQREMVVRGKMHGYMRMYWAKKIIEWTSSPEEAYERCLLLNNRWELDGRDPNGYAGVAWSFGKHDQGWAERAIFGKVRYMNKQGLHRKFKMELYVNKIDKLVREVGLPPHLDEVSKQSTAHARKQQKTLSDVQPQKKKPKVK